MLSVTAGVHRLWTHKSYEVVWPIRLFLLFFYLMAGQRSLYRWVVDHRIHHKFTDTPADPHDSSRGLWYSHMGHFLQAPNPEYIEQIKRVSLDDFRSQNIGIGIRKGERHNTLLTMVTISALKYVTLGNLSHKLSDIRNLKA